MNWVSVRKALVLLAWHSFLLCDTGTVNAQTVRYSSENVFINYPDQLQLVANVGGNHHLLSFVANENPVAFIFNAKLEFQAKVTMPFKFPERSEIRIIPFDHFYYLCIHSRFSPDYLLGKIDGKGNFTDLSSAFQKLLQSQSGNIKLGFQLIPNLNELCMVYHTALTDIEKSTVVIVQTDSLLQVVFTHKVVYEFKRDEEKLLQESMMFGRYLLILKSAQSGTALELMKVNLATGYSIVNRFRSSGYFYSQSGFSYNMADSSVTVSALLTEPRGAGRPRRFVFISRLNKILIEQAPLAILKSQFVKNTYTNFLLVDGLSKWIPLKAEWGQAYNTRVDNTVSLYQDFTMPDPNSQTVADNNRLLARTGSTKYDASDYTDQGVRFSLMDKNFKIIGDTLVPNTRNSYTVRADQFARFAVRDREYMLVGQQFFKKRKGLLMVNADEKHQLVFTDVRVNDRNDYLLSKAQVIPQQGMIIPYIQGREAGLIKIIVE